MNTTTPADRTAAFIEACGKALERQAQAANGWPVPLILPEPEDAAENEGLEMFLAELRQATGAQVKFNPNWSASADVKFADGVTQWFVGPRYSW